MASFRIHPLQLDKESWENIANLVYKSFYAVSSTFSSLKKWTEKQEERWKVSDEQHEQMEEQIGTTNASLEKTQQQLDNLSAELQALSTQTQHQVDTFAVCLHHALLTSAVVVDRFSASFGIESQAQVDAPPPVALDEEQHADLEMLTTLSLSLEASLPGLGEAFDAWGEQRSQVDRRQQDMQLVIDELSDAADRTRERLLAWREMLKESSHVVDSLSAALVTTQGEIRELQESQVQQHNIDDAVQRKGQELEELIAQTEAGVGEVSRRMEQHSEEVERSIRELRRDNEEKIEEHSTSMGRLLERNLNPINAYLNTMHVRSDAARADIDKLHAQVPVLSSRIDDVATRLTACDTESRRADEALEKRVGLLETGITHVRDVEDRNRSALEAAIAQAATEAEEKHLEIDKDIGVVRESVEALRNGEVTDIRTDLKGLEHRVAKWVHAHPMPAKISEARLFALEARLTGESDARLQLEQQVKTLAEADLSTGSAIATLAGGGYTPPVRGSGGNTLPALFSQTAVNTISVGGGPLIPPPMTDRSKHGSMFRPRQVT